MVDNKYISVIGLEVHVELKTKSKMFCGCSADYFGNEPNTHVCPVCLGLPGALPVPNKKAIEWCVMIGLAFNCKIPLVSKFDRKNYFYPDLPKGYQISQYGEPFCVNGYVILNSFQDLGREANKMPKQVRHDREKKIRIRRVHMEEDTAKLIHQSGVQNFDKGYSLIDFNRSGVPLVEIVTEPDFESTYQVVQYLKKLQQIVRYLNVSNADMEKGEMRLEPNISLRLTTVKNKALISKLPSYKVEVKNINSFRFVEKAINYEIERQRKILESAKTPIQETRGWDEKRQITVAQRVKEEANEYRYFPEPDIPPIRFTQDQIRQLTDQIPELPDHRSLRFQKGYDLSTYNSQILVKEKSTANYFEEAVRVNQKSKIKNQKYVDIKSIANWIINKKVDINTILPAQLIQTIIASSQSTAFEEIELKKIVKQVILDNPKAVRDYKKGKENAVMFLVGQTMKKMPKGIDANLVKKNLEKELSTLSLRGSVS